MFRPFRAKDLGLDGDLDSDFDLGRDFALDFALDSTYIAGVIATDARSP